MQYSRATPMVRAMSAYPFVTSYHDAGLARGPRRAILWHMAEGGGTVGYLHRRNPNGVSVHFVIEYSGRTVQMLREDHMHTSINPDAIRRTDDPTGVFGATVAQDVMRDWWRNPNHASIGVEMEGFARSGPNALQRGAMVALAQDLQGRHAGIGNLGHRDYASYKQCPGQTLDWASIGGHGAAVSEVDVDGLVLVDELPAVVGRGRVNAGREVIRVSDRLRIVLPQDATGRIMHGTFRSVDLDLPGYLVTISGTSCWVRTSDVASFVDSNEDDTIAFNDGVNAAVLAAETAHR